MYVILIAALIFVVRMIIRSGEVFKFQNQISSCLNAYQRKQRQIWAIIKNKRSSNQTLSEQELYIYSVFGGDSQKFEDFLQFQWDTIINKNSHTKLWLSGKPLRFENFFSPQEVIILR